MTRAAARTAPPSPRAAPATARTSRARPSTARTAPASPRTPGRAPVRPELRLVPPATPARPRRRVRAEEGSRRGPFVLLVVALLVGTTLGLLILNTAIAVDSLKATQLRAANAERAQELQHLEQQVVSAGTPARIASAAVAAGLVPAGPAAFLVIAPDGSSTLRGTPVPAEAPPAPATESPADQAPTDQAPAQGPADAAVPGTAGTADGD